MADLSGVTPANQTKEGQFTNFSRGHSGTKVRCESCLFSQGKTPEFTKMGEIHELFVLVLSLVWFAEGRLLNLVDIAENRLTCCCLLIRLAPVSRLSNCRAVLFLSCLRLSRASRCIAQPFPRLPSELAGSGPIPKNPILLRGSFFLRPSTLDKLGSHLPWWLKLLSFVQKGKLARA